MKYHCIRRRQGSVEGGPCADVSWVRYFFTAIDIRGPARFPSTLAGVNIYLSHRDEAPVSSRMTPTTAPLDTAPSPGEYHHVAGPRQLATNAPTMPDAKDFRQHETGKLVLAGQDEFGDHANALGSEQEDLSTRPLALTSSSASLEATASVSSSPSSCAIVARSGSCSGSPRLAWVYSVRIFANGRSVSNDIILFTFK